MTDKQKAAYEWALNQKYTSVAADYARTLAENIKERLNPQPLTAEETNELNEDHVYIMHVDTIKNGALWHMNGWHILTASTFQNHGQCKWFVDNGWSELDGNYGK